MTSRRNPPPPLAYVDSPQSQEEWRERYLAELRNTTHNLAAVRFLNEGWVAAWLFSNADLIEMLTLYVIPKAPQEFLRRSGPKSAIAGRLQPATVLRLRMDALRELPVKEMVRELCALSIWEDDARHMLSRTHVELIVATIALLPVDATPQLRKHVHDQLVLAHAPRWAIGYITNLVMNTRNDPRANNAALDKLIAAINRAAMPHVARPREFNVWHSLILKRIQLRTAS